MAQVETGRIAQPKQLERVSQPRKLKLVSFGNQSVDTADLKKPEAKKPEANLLSTFQKIGRSFYPFLAPVVSYLGVTILSQFNQLCLKWGWVDSHPQGEVLKQLFDTQKLTPETFLKKVLTDDNPVLGSGTFSSFMAVPISGFEAFGVKVLDDAPLTGYAAMTNQIFGGSPQDDAPARLKKLQLTLEQNKPLKIEWMNAPAIDGIAFDLAVIKDKYDKPLAVLQNRITGAAILEEHQASLQYFKHVVGDTPEALSHFRFLSSQSEAYQQLVNAAPKLTLKGTKEQMQAAAKEPINQFFKENLDAAKAVLPQLLEQQLTALDELAKPKGLNLSFNLSGKEPTQEEKRAQALLSLAVANKTLNHEYGAYLKRLNAIPQDQLELFLKRLEAARSFGVKMDIQQHPGNILWDPKSGELGLVDVSMAWDAASTAHETYAFEQLLPTLLFRLDHVKLDSVLFPELFTGTPIETEMKAKTCTVLDQFYAAARSAGVRLNGQPEGALKRLMDTVGYKVKN